MPKFCTRCGTQADDAARFCDACGEPFPALSVNTPILKSAVNVESIPVAKIVKIAGISITGLIILAGVAWFFTKADSPPDAGALAIMLNTDQAATDQRVCLDNLHYDKDKISVSGYDSNTKQWLDALVSAGLYNAPEKVESGGWFSQTHYQYQQTEIGLKAVRRGKLCFANSIVVDNVTYTEPQKNNDTSLIRGHYSYHYNAPEKWVSLPAVIKLASDKLGKTQFEDDVLLLAAQGKWHIATADDRRSIREFAKTELTKAQLDMPIADSGGLVSWFKNLFAGLSGNPLIGQWHSAESGDTITFTSTEMKDSNRTVPVTYQMQDKAVMVSVSGRAAINFVIVDADHILMDAGFFKLPLTRVN